MTPDLFSYLRESFQASVVEPFVFMIAIVAVERLYYALFFHATYGWRDGYVTLGIAVVEFTVALLVNYLLFFLFRWIEPHSFFKVSNEAWYFFVLYFFVGDFVFYMAHFSAHKIRWFWAEHSVHHSSERMNFFAGNRNGVLSLIAGVWIFTLPFVMLGIPFFRLNEMIALVLSYQFFLHTEIVRRWGPLEKILCTPSLHRVHHGTIDLYLDTNFGGITCFYDRLFGTYQSELPGVDPKYGVKGYSPRPSMLACLFGVWREVASNPLKAFTRVGSENVKKR